MYGRFVTTNAAPLECRRIFAFNAWAKPRRGVNRLSSGTSGDWCCLPGLTGDAGGFGRCDGVVVRLSSCWA